LTPLSASTGISVDLAATFQDIAAVQDVVVYEARAAQSLCYPIEFTTAGPYPALPLRGPLARWCRVNDEILHLPQQANIVDDATAEETSFVNLAPVRACVPLLANRTLVGLVVFIDARPSWDLPDERAQAVMTSARQWAPQWRNARGTYEAISRARAEYRSQQLGVAGELAASAAHEIRNPLAAIRSLVQFVRDTEPLADDRARLLGEVLEEVDRVDRTVGGLLELSRRQTVQHEVLDLAAILSRAVEFIAPYARKRQLQLDVPTTDGPLDVVGDPHELRQVFVNVLLNACQACQPGGHIDTFARTVGIDDVPHAEIVVRDTGHGITAANLAQVFDPFFTTKPEGTGLGLAICRDVLRRHHGTIAITARPGGGTGGGLQVPLP